MDFKEITKTKFENAYNKYLPGPWVKFAYRYFSKETEKKDFKPKRIIFGSLLVLFFLGLFFTIMDLSYVLIAAVTIPYTVILVLLALYLFSSIILNNLRIRKIRKILDVTKEQYNTLVNKFYG